jgi:hypothetical protein
MNVNTTLKLMNGNSVWTSMEIMQEVVFVSNVIITLTESTVKTANHFSTNQLV